MLPIVAAIVIAGAAIVAAIVIAGALMVPIMVAAIVLIMDWVGAMMPVGHGGIAFCVPIAAAIVPLIIVPLLMVAAIVACAETEVELPPMIRAAVKPNSAAALLK